MASNPKYYSIPNFGAGPTPTNYLITTTTAAVALRLSDALHRRLHLRFLLRSSLKSISHLGDVPRLKDLCHERALQFTGFDCFQWSCNALSATLMSLSFFNGDESKSNSKDFGKPQSSRRDFFDGRQWTNVLLAANVLVYIAQSVSDGKLLYWGAKINSLISEGQLWRLATSSFLHANIGHLLVNCYSLNSVGPAVETICGPRRYLTVYIASAVASSAMSYWFCKAPAVGASGAIFGLVHSVNHRAGLTTNAKIVVLLVTMGVGSFAMFILRHRGMIKGTEGDLKHIAQVIVLNMTIGLLSKGIDNWGHAGGLIGGAAVSWFLGPAWEVESVSRDGRRTLMDRAPIYSLIKRHPK